MPRGKSFFLRLKTDTIMRVKHLAFLYNIRHHYPDPNDAKTQLEVDFDDPLTIEWIIKHLKNIGYKVLPIEADEKAYIKLFKYRKNIDFAFDFSFGLYGKNKYGHIPSMLEMLQIPFATSSSFTRNLTLNKVRMKQVLIANNVPTLPYQVFKSKLEVNKRLLSFPLIVKPIAQGSSAGISNKSVVYNDSELTSQVDYICQTFSQAAFVEPYLNLREFSVPILGNPPKILPIIEPDFRLLPKKYLPIDSMEVKWIYEEESESNHLICPAKINSDLRSKILDISLRTWNVLEINDICRIDMRNDKNNNVYVLDVNAPPGLIPPEVSKTSYFPLVARVAGMEYEELLKNILDSAIKRYNI